MSRFSSAWQAFWHNLQYVQLSTGDAFELEDRTVYRFLGLVDKIGMRWVGVTS